MKKYTSFLILCTICFLFIVSFLLSRWIALTIGLIILGAFGYLEKIFNIEITRKVRITLLISFIILSACNIFYSYYKEYTTNQKVQQANDVAEKAKQQVVDLSTKEQELRGKLSEAENSAKTAKKQINDFSDYGEVATYAFNGYQQSGIHLSPFTPVSKWTQGYLIVTDDNIYRFNCNADAIRHYQEIIDKYPKFPFPYIALSGCLLKNHDPTWRKYEIKAKSILEITTKIPLHCTVHDGWLEQVNKALDPKQISDVFISDGMQKPK
jgi:cell division protein FtsL